MSAPKANARRNKEEVPDKNKSTNSQHAVRRTDTGKSPAAMGTSASTQSPRSTQEPSSSSPQPDTAVFARLGEKGTRPELKDSKRVELFRQVQSGDATVQQLQQIPNLDVNQPGPYNRRLLHAAAESDKPDLIEHIIDRGANLDAQDADGWFPEHFAASADAVASLRLLFNRRTKQQMEKLRNSQGQTPLMTAAIFGSAKAAELLLSNRGSDANAADSDGDTAAILAVRCGRMNVLKTLVKHGGIKLHIKNKEGKTAKDYAMESKDAEMMKLLR